MIAAILARLAGSEAGNSTTKDTMQTEFSIVRPTHNNESDADMKIAGENNGSKNADD